MKVKGKKIVSLFFVFSLLALSGDLLAKKQGTKLIIQKRDGQVIQGELIFVKKNSLLLLESGTDVSVDIKNVKVIKIVRKSKFLQGLGTGLLIGAGSGALLGLLSGDDPPGLFNFTAGEKALIFGIVLGLPGGIIGGISGAGKEGYETVLIGGVSPEGIEMVLQKLRKKARIRDYK